MTQKSNTLIVVIGLLSVACFSFGVYQTYQNKQTQTELKQAKQAVITQQKKSEKEQQAYLKQKKQADQLVHEKNNSGKDYDSQKDYQEHVSRLFEVLFNYDPDNFSDRKSLSESYLSDDLMKDYFSDESVYTDSNGVSSQLNELKVFTQSVQEKELNGLVLAKYETKIGQNKWTKAMTLFEVTYDTNRQKITAIQNLGNGYTGDLFDS